MFARTTTITIEELSFEILLEAIDREMKRLKEQADEARDQADRDTWAILEARRHYLHRVRSQVTTAQVELGDLSQEAQEEAANRVSRTRHKMPRSAANAEILRKEREEAQEAARDHAIRNLKPVPKSGQSRSR